VAEIAPPPDEQQPTSTTTTARGPNCTPKDNPLKAVTPESFTTATSSPAFLFYIPKTEAEEAELVITDDLTGNEVYKIRLQLPQKAGILRVSTPSDLVLLKDVTPYTWDFSIVCSEQEMLNDRVIGKVQYMRATAELTQSLQAVDPSERYKVYQSAGKQGDALVELDKLRRQNPEDLSLQQSWYGLLQAFKMEKIALEPLVEAKE